MKTISLTIPLEHSALTRSAEMLKALASDLPGVEEQPPAPNYGASSTSVDDQHVSEPPATEVFSQPQEATPSLFAETPAEAPKLDAAPVAAASPEPEQLQAPANVVTETTTPTNNGVDLAPSTTNPSVAIPWDARIHASSKAKLAKKPNGWKMKRGVDAGLIGQVEAELIAAMSASPANPVVGNASQVGGAEPAATVGTAQPTTLPGASPAVAPANPNVPAQPAPAAVSPSTTPSTPAAPAQPAAPGTINTFPELMARITASGLDQSAVTAAVNKQGLQALPLLASRPDLIPGVAAELFPGG